jgi:hypothetical protein
MRFLCCGRKAVKNTEDDKRPATATNEKEDAPNSTEVATAPPVRMSEEMDYARERREAEERELERTRSHISGRSIMGDERPAKPAPPRLSLTSQRNSLPMGAEKRESGGFLNLPSPVTSPISPKLDHDVEESDEDWARGVLESVSRSGSLRGGSRPVTPAVVVSDSELRRAEILHGPDGTSYPSCFDKTETRLNTADADKTSLYINQDDAEAFITYDANGQAPPTPQIPQDFPTHFGKFEKIDRPPMEPCVFPEVPKPKEKESIETPVFEAIDFDNIKHDDVIIVSEKKEEKKEEVVEEKVPEIEAPTFAPLTLDNHRASFESTNRQTSMYIGADVAATFMDFNAALNASLAPPTPAMSDVDENDKRDSLSAISIRDSLPVRSVSPAPSYLSERILNDKRSSTISIVSTIASHAASAAQERHALATKRTSTLSAYSFTSIYSTRPNSPCPPQNHRLSILRGTPTPRSGTPTSMHSDTSDSTTSSGSRLSDASNASEPSSEAQLLPYLAPLTAQLLPKLDKLLSTTSILSHYSRWEQAMSLRREVRAFIASGVDDFLDSDGDIENPHGLQKAVDAFLARGKVCLDAAPEEEEESNGKGMFGDVRAFWASGRGSVVAV